MLLYSKFIYIVLINFFITRQNMLLLPAYNFILLQKQVIVTKSVEFMPFFLSLFSFLASSSWMAYGLVSHELFLAVSLITNLVSLLLKQQLLELIKLALDLGFSNLNF